MENAASDAALALPTNAFQYCCRGEICLPQEEIDKINQNISQANFRIEIYIPEPDLAKPLKKGRSDSFSRSFSAKEDETPNSLDYKRRVSHSSLKSSFSRDDDTLMLSSFEGTEKRSLRKRKQRITYYEEFVEDATDGNYREIKQEKVNKSHKETPKRQPSGTYERKQSQQLYRAVPVLKRNLPKLPRDTWEYTAYRLLQTIKYMDTDKWFWYPVDPVADGVPNYPKVVKTPMDFHTITERLHLRHYTNPFGWQCDFRQIFFNAFLFYTADNRIWQAAEHLAKSYEDKLSNTKYLHPQEFKELLAKGDDAMRAELLEYNDVTFNRKGRWGTGAEGIDDGGIGRPLEKRKAAQHNKHRHVIDEFMYHDDDDDSFNELSSAASADEYLMPLESERGRHRGPKKRGAQAKMAYAQRKYRSGHSSDGSESAARMRFTGEFIVPEVGQVPPPPPLQKLGAMERSLTPAQTRTLEINITRLAPNQRKAALELVQDDLGILAEAFMNDRTFTFDPSLLSVEKQRRVFMYINQMVKRNIEAMQAAFVRPKKAKHTKDRPRLETKGSGISNPSEIFDASSSSSSSISDVASNFLSSDEFFDSSDDEGTSVKHTARQSNSDTPLPEYTPIDDYQSEKVHLTRGIMGDHVDFLTHLESQSAADDPNQTQQGKKSAWMEWKGQAIHHGTVAQQNGVKPRSVDEQIAESFDARI